MERETLQFYRRANWSNNNINVVILGLLMLKGLGYAQAFF
jgi:hypothetical protein